MLKVSHLVDQSLQVSKRVRQAFCSKSSSVRGYAVYVEEALARLKKDAKKLDPDEDKDFFVCAEDGSSRLRTQSELVEELYSGQRGHTAYSEPYEPQNFPSKINIVSMFNHFCHACTRPYRNID